MEGGRGGVRKSRSCKWPGTGQQTREVTSLVAWMDCVSLAYCSRLQEGVTPELGMQGQRQGQRPSGASARPGSVLFFCLYLISDP